MNNTGLYIYCLVNASESISFNTPGIGKEKVFTVSYKDIGAVVSRSPVIEYEICRENLIAHQLVMEESMANFVVLPVKFGTVTEGEDGENEIIEKVLKTDFSELNELFKEMADKHEMGLKVYWKDMNSIFAQIPNENPEIKRLKGAIEIKTSKGKTMKERNNIVKLGEMVKSALENKRELEKNRILSPLKKLAFDFKDNPSAFDKMILNAAFLIERKREEAFFQEVQRLDGQSESEIIYKYVGPVPPCNFVEIEIAW